MQKKITLKKIANGYYKLSDNSDKSLYTLYLFLCYGPYPDSYIAFLEDKNRTTFYGNVANLQNNSDLVTIEIDEFLVPDVPSYTITQKNLLEALIGYEKYKILGVDSIEIILDDDVLTITCDLVS